MDAVQGQGGGVWVRIDWKHNEGLELLIGQIKDFDGQIKEVAIECIQAAQKELKQDFINRLEPHRDEGDAIDSIDIKPLVIDGNIISGEVGSYLEKNQTGFFHAKYQEYGAKSHRGDKWWVTFVARPWKRSAESKMRFKFIKISRDIMKRRLGL